MVFIKLTKCLKDPKQLIKFAILISCVCFTSYQLGECVKKLLDPPVSTYYKFNLNDSLKYPAITICRTPGFKVHLFPKYGLNAVAWTGHESILQHFKFDQYTLEEFFAEVTYSFEETITLFGFDGVGFRIDSPKPKPFRPVLLLNKGLCHQFVPSNNSIKFSNNGGWFFYLSFNEVMRNVYSSMGDALAGFEIYVHGLNEVITGREGQESSFVERIFLEPGESAFVNLKLQTFKQFDTAKEPCNSAPQYSQIKCWEECLQTQIVHQVNCTGPWLKFFNGTMQQCNDYQATKKLISGFNDVNRTEYLKKCQCATPCFLEMYNSYIENRRFIGTQDSTIRFYFASNLITEMEEIVGYDWNAFLSDIGGSLGFLLGLSVIGIIAVIEDTVRAVYEKWKRCKDQQHSGVQRRSTSLKFNGNSLRHVVAFLTELDRHDVEDQPHQAATKEQEDDYKY